MHVTKQVVSMATYTIKLEGEEELDRLSRILSTANKFQLTPADQRWAEALRQELLRYQLGKE